MMNFQETVRAYKLLEDLYSFVEAVEDNSRTTARLRKEATKLKKELEEFSW